MPYTSDKPKLPESSDELRARIPGWGADLDPKDRPSVPRERFDLGATGAHWDFPERQPEKWPRERSIEHKFLTPVFGTSCPPRGLSGVIRRYAYAKYSEGRAAHWLLLLAADRVDAKEAVLRSLLSTRPDNPVTQTGVLSEFRRHGIASRFGQKRADVVHQPLDLIVVGAPWAAAAGLAYLAIRRVAGRRR
jgi:GNAT superfamily N-acetyltransferase